MSQNPLINSGTQFSKTPSLKPPLAAALASLEVQLDRELARYRRTRSGYRAANQSHPTSSNSSQQQFLAPLTTFNSTAGTIQSSVEENHVEIPASEVNANTPSTYITETLTTPPPPPPITPKVATISDSVPASAPPSASASNNSSIVPVATVKNESQPEISDSPSPASQPDDYLESSEALLRSLTEEEPKAQKRPKANNDSLLSPLGIGSMLLLLMASLILGYVVINPKSLKFSFDGLFKRNDPNVAENIDATGRNAQTVAQPQLTPIPKYPNLAKDEFPEVNSPNDVVGLKPKSKPTPTPMATIPNPTTASPVQQPPSAIPINPLPQQATTTIPPVAVSPSPTPVPEIPIDEIKPSADGFYHVVIDKNSDADFANARQAIPDAYLSPDGKLIYLGAIKNKQKAQELLTEIQGKGLKARIRQP